MPWICLLYLCYIFIYCVCKKNWFNNPFFLLAALKRSFDIEDVDDIPSFSSASPISPSSPHFFRNHSKPPEVQGVCAQSPSLAFKNSNNSLSSAAHHSCISLSSNPSPVLKSRSVVSSLSFNRGSMNKTTIHNNGSSVTRAASFQSRLNPNGYSVLSGPGSDNDSPHSSTSSLDYSGGFGGATHLAKLGSYPSPSSEGKYYRIQSQMPLQHLEKGANLVNIHNLKKFSSHGSVFHSAMDQGPGRIVDAPEAQGVNLGSMPSLDLQICDGGGGIVNLQRSGGRMSPGLHYANADTNWNGHRSPVALLPTSFVGEDCSGSEGLGKQQEPQLKVSQPKTKETPRLNKFPLDLDSLVSSCSITSPMKPQVKSVNPPAPKPPPRSTGSFLPSSSPPSTLASTSASLSSLDSSSDTQPFSPHHHILPASTCSPVPSKGTIPVQEMSSSPASLYPVQSPDLGIFSEPQIIQLTPTSPNSFLTPRGIQPLAEGTGDSSDSVGSILQRIASFSRSAATDTTQTVATQPPTVQTKGPLSPVLGCPAGITSMPSRKPAKEKQQGKATF